MARARANSLQTIDAGLSSITPVLEKKTSPPPTTATPTTKIAPVKPGFLADITSFQWMREPKSSIKIIGLLVAAWGVLELAPIPTLTSNPLTPLFIISHVLPSLPGDEGSRYEKGILDFAFLAFYIIVFSFLRQSITEIFFRPLAKYAGLKSNVKQLRFMEQSYAIFYNLCTVVLGLWIMSQGKTWWYQTEHMWLEFPHWRMTQPLKYYYLLQTAYWIQQMLVLAVRLEKPRSDYTQLIIHHLVTLWLIGWSYSTNLTVIGVMIFVSMDMPEIFLATSKSFNYIGYQHISEVSFAVLLLTWTYMRHYLNMKILWSVWYEFDLIPEFHRTWSAPLSSPGDWWMFGSVASGRLPAWIQYQIFLPIFILQLVNGFWSFLLWRILFRIIMGTKLVDSREEGEEDEDEEEVAVTKKNK